MSFMLYSIGRARAVGVIPRAVGEFMAIPAMFNC